MSTQKRGKESARQRNWELADGPVGAHSPEFHPPAAHQDYPTPRSGSPLSGSPVWKPGVIPLRPLSLTDIFNGALGYVRANPKPALGLTTVVILATAVIDLVISLSIPTTDGMPQELAGPAVGGLASLPARVVLSGMLTVLVARSVVGVPISAAQVWHRVRPRVLTLIGLTVLQFTATVIIAAAAVLAIVGLGSVAGWSTATVIAIPLILLAIVGLVYLGTALCFARAAIVLEHRNIPNTISRSLGLVKGRFWRTLGIMLLASIVAALVAGAISLPFSVIGGVLAAGAEAGAPSIGGVIVATIGEAIGQIIATLFLAGVMTLLYVDARIRSEAFDFTLMAPGSLDADDVWLAR